MREFRAPRTENNENNKGGNYKLEFTSAYVQLDSNVAIFFYSQHSIALVFHQSAIFFKFKILMIVNLN